MDMKSFKLWQLPGFMLCLLLGLVFFLLAIRTMTRQVAEAYGVLVAVDRPP